MYLCSLSTIIPLYFFLHHPIFSVAGKSPTLYYPRDDIAVNCGSSGNSIALNGRRWIGDIGSKYITSSDEFMGKVSSSKVQRDQSFITDPIPYTTARISLTQFTYTFRVTPGPKFIRLHFYPISHRMFKRSKAFFTVKAGPYTLLSNFSVSLTADALGLQSVVKEFCVNVEENQPLIITFSPSRGGSLDHEVYAFVNGIEVVSMPTGLYHTPEDELGAHVVGKKFRFSIDKSTALEMVQRLNVGGSFISSKEDTGMFREWSGDSNYLLESSVLPATTTIRIKHRDIKAYDAPQKVYQTSWLVLVPEEKRPANKTLNFTWKLPVDLGFRYLVRFHFCELEYEIEEGRNTEFSIFVNEEVAEAKADVIKWSGRSGVAVHRDYVVMMEGDRTEGKRDLLISLFPHKDHNHEWPEQIDAILKGLEVFKLSNHDKNLAGMNPVPPPAHASPSINPNPRRFVFASRGNAIATGVVIVLTLLNVIVYQLRILGEEYRGEKNHSSSPPSEGLCRRFSLAEVLSVTNNFDNELVIGRGGFGEVYKAFIDGGATAVAMKRLNSRSMQGAAEFWTEIDMLSNLRHAHLVSLIGYCDERHEMILVYEYMENGTLADHLYKINGSDNNGTICHDLSWEQRLNICIGAARGLDYLHTGTRHGIIHRDVKTTNILLDKDWVAKIADFGLCKMGTASHSRTHVSTNVKGTFGYLDPEYFLTRRLTKKSDVFALGVVMLEVLCGRPAVDTRLVEEQHSLVLWVQQCIKEKKIDEIIDPSLKEQISTQRLKMFVEVVNKCIHSRPNGRPTMSDVVVSLECALKDQCRDSSTVEDEKGEEEEYEEDASISQVVDEQIEWSSEQHNALPQDTAPSTSNPVQFNENAQGQKRSKGNLFQRSIAFLAKGMDTRWKKRDYDFNSEHSVLDSLSNSERLQWDNATHLYRHFSIAEIRTATRNFHRNLFIGEGGFVKVYKGSIDHGTVDVAIKCLKKSAGAQLFGFTVQMREQLHHLHIASLIGYCEDEDAVMLVYNYMENGSLSNHLYPSEGGRNNRHPLSWKKRLEICIGAAQGLQYLHSRKIIHRDIKPANILLDTNWVAKISDFEIATVLPMGEADVVTAVCGTLGYIDPGYHHTGCLTKKSDVYSFGVVLLEVLCARKPIDLLLAEDHNPLDRWFKTCVRRKMIDQVIDPHLVGWIAPGCLREFVKIAWNCRLDWRIDRPSMDDVVGSLQTALQLQQTWERDMEVECGIAHNDPKDELFRFITGRAYNNMLSYDSLLDVGDTDFSEVSSDRETDIISQVSFSAFDSD